MTRPCALEAMEEWKKPSLEVRVRSQPLPYPNEFFSSQVYGGRMDPIQSEWIVWFIVLKSNPSSAIFDQSKIKGKGEKWLEFILGSLKILDRFIGSYDCKTNFASSNCLIFHQVQVKLISRRWLFCSVFFPLWVPKHDLWLSLFFSCIANLFC